MKKTEKKKPVTLPSKNNQLISNLLYIFPSLITNFFKIVRVDTFLPLPSFDLGVTNATAQWELTIRDL